MKEPESPESSSGSSVPDGSGADPLADLLCRYIDRFILKPASPQAREAASTVRLRVEGMATEWFSVPPFLPAAGGSPAIATRMVKSINPTPSVS